MILEPVESKVTDDEKYTISRTLVFQILLNMDMYKILGKQRILKKTSWRIQVTLTMHWMLTLSSQGSRWLHLEEWKAFHSSTVFCKSRSFRNSPYPSDQKKSFLGKQAHWRETIFLYYCYFYVQVTVEVSGLCIQHLITDCVIDRLISVVFFQQLDVNIYRNEL